MDTEVEDASAPAVGSSRFSFPGALLPRRAGREQETESSSPAYESSGVAGAGGEGSGAFPELHIEPGRAKQSELCV